MPSEGLSRMFFGTDLWLRMIVVWTLLFLNGLLWSSAFEYYFASFDSSAMAIAGTSLSLIVGSVYSRFVERTMNDYMNAPISYVTLLMDSKSVLTMIDGLLATNDEKFRARLMDVAAAVQQVAFYSFRIYRPDNRHVIGDSTVVYDVEYDPSCVQNLGAEVDALSAVHESNHIPEDMPVFEGNVFDFAREMESYVWTKIVDLKENETEIVNVFSRRMEPIWKRLKELEISSNVSSPPVFKVHMQLLFALYFFVYFPINVWGIAGWFWGIMFYPTVTLGILAFGVYSQWIGDPMAADCPVKVSDLRGLRLEIAVKIPNDIFRRHFEE